MSTEHKKRVSGRPSPRLLGVFFILLAPMATAGEQPLVTMDVVIVGDAGNAPDVNGFGAVSHEYAIGKYEVTIRQYTAFLNAVATVTTVEGSDHIHLLWRESMASDSNTAGIARAGSGTSADPFHYTIIGDGNRPIAGVSWMNAARFANWMHNGATVGANTENGAYELNGTIYGIIPKNPGAKWWLPSEDEWYKAACYNPMAAGGTGGYSLYATGSNTPPGNNIGNAPNQANYFNGVYSTTGSAIRSPTENYLTAVGSFAGSASHYGTFDQCGNVSEWTDGSGWVYPPESNPGMNWPTRIHWGGAWSTAASDLPHWHQGNEPFENAAGFRLAGSAQQPPTISDIADQSFNQGEFIEIAFTAGDAATPPEMLVLTATSSDQTLVPNDRIFVSSLGGIHRSLTLQPVEGRSGTATITITVNDGELSASDTFRLTIINTRPVIGAIADRAFNLQELAQGGMIEVPFTVNDAETAAELLECTVTSNNQVLIQDVAMIINALGGGNQVLYLYPSPGQSGTAEITITAGDGYLTATRVFKITILGGFDHWLANSGLPEDRRQPGDRNGPLGLPNVLAYAMGLNPLAATAAEMPALRDVSPANGTLHLIFRQAKSRPDVALSVLGSSDPTKPWAPAEVRGWQVLREGEDWQEVDAEIGIPVDGKSYFLRCAAHLTGQ